ncbi:MAG: alanine--tRNA ligase, partial [Kiritimatiellae bacterium]|nr:alanine--tRNA ligase [Kiritimatiellia bacterium]
MKADELRDMYLSFFKAKGHAVISGASLIPENDPTVLFTTAGMHPLVPYLLGQEHPAGTRLCDCQLCIRTGDIDVVGDASHLTFFEMLGNWSLGDYFKEEAIAWSHEFLTSKSYLGLDPEHLYVTVFEGNAMAPRDEASIATWKKLGVPDSRIFALPVEDNWWGPAGQVGPCGPDTEMFIDTAAGTPLNGAKPGSHPRFFEIWNDVFMQYEKTADGSYVPLKKNNVDTGMGVERTVTMLQGKNTVYETELFAPILASIASGASMRMDESAESLKAYRVVADHVRSAAFIMADPHDVIPGNLGQGYVLRRLIRRAIRYAKTIGLPPGFFKAVTSSVIENYTHVYPDLGARQDHILTELQNEEDRFEVTLDRGMAELSKVVSRMKEHGQAVLPGRVAFKLYDTCGFPLEFTEEICAEEGFSVDQVGYDKAFEKHKQVSKQGAEKAFKGGLADASEATTRLHTATHLLHKSLQLVLGSHVKQKGSNITAERLRFDFAHPEKMTPEQIAEVETIVNDQIDKDLPIQMHVMTLEEAKEKGAMALFSNKYEEQVKVYTIGEFSMEVCGGPHAKATQELGRFKIKKEESSSAGVRRIRAVLS